MLSFISVIFEKVSGSRDYAALSLLRKAVRGEDTGKR